MHKFLFYNKFIIFLYIFRALCAHHQEVKIVLYTGVIIHIWFLWYDTLPYFLYILQNKI